MEHQEDSKPLLDREECSDDEVVTLPDQKSSPAHSSVLQVITASLLSIVDLSAALSTVSKSIRNLHSFVVQNPTLLAVVAVAVTAFLVSMFLGWNLVSAYGEIGQLKRHINKQNEMLYFCRNDNSSNTRIIETDSGIHTTVEGFTNSTKDSKMKENLTLSINSVLAVVAALLIVCIMIACVGHCFCD